LQDEMLKPQWKKFKVMDFCLVNSAKKKHAPGREVSLLCCRTALELKFVSNSVPDGVYVPAATISHF